jgi:hypothetical protein
MSIQFNGKSTGISAAISSTVSAIVTGASSMIGRNWLSVGACGGLGFGLIQGTVSKIALDNMPGNLKARVFVSEFVGGATACGLSYAAASFGFIAAPVSIPTAAVLTVAVVAFKTLFMVKINAHVTALADKADARKLADKIAAEQRKTEPPESTLVKE